MAAMPKTRIIGKKLRSGTVVDFIPSICTNPFALHAQKKRQWFKEWSRYGLQAAQRLRALHKTVLVIASGNLRE